MKRVKKKKGQKPIGRPQTIHWITEYKVKIISKESEEWVKYEVEKEKQGQYKITCMKSL
jgi:hypothetical protein